MVRLAVLNTLRSAASYSRMFGLLGIAALGLHAEAQVLTQDSFTYPDGLIVGAPGSAWVNNYLPTNQANVIAGQLFLTQSEAEAVRIDFTPTTSGLLFARFQVTFTQLPTGVGNYFAFFRQSGTDNNRARVWVTTNGAAAGKFRLGLKTFQDSPLSAIAEDLSLQVPYKVVLRYNVTNHDSTLWLDPGQEAAVTRRADSPGGSGAIGVAHFAFLQTANFNGGGGMGSLYVDDLVIGRKFYDVWSGPRFASISRPPNHQVALTGFGVPSTNYSVLATTNLASPDWNALGDIVANPGGDLQFTDSTAPNIPTRFYRLLAH
jgi:hypothetical protein